LGIGDIFEEQSHHKAELRTNPEHRPHDYFRQGIFEGAEEGVEELLKASVNTNIKTKKRLRVMVEIKPA